MAKKKKSKLEELAAGIIRRPKNSAPAPAKGARVVRNTKARKRK
jgi:hypothetical protein